MMSTPPPRSPTRFVALLLGASCLVRLGTLGWYPLTDSTEARYGEIARKMLATGNLITPWFDHGVPFWGKPPLSFWSSAASMAVFGVNEFGARLAPFLFFVGTLALLGLWPRAADHDDAPLRLTAGLIIASSLLGLILGGAVMTDAALMFSTTLCMVTFWRAVQPAPVARHWGWLFFVGIGLGLLAKGPVAVVLTALSVALWTVRGKAWRTVWTQLPWVGGTLLAIGIALPWYVMAERATPGFLRYYILGEHVQRYLTRGWTGDLYGAGRAKAPGMIWLFALAALVPWTFLLPSWFGHARRAWRVDVTAIATRDYLLCWALATPLFFTLSRNILLAYVAPALPALALLLAPAALRSLRGSSGRRVVTAASLLFSVLSALVLLVRPELLDRASQRAFFRQRPPAVGEPVIYLYERPFSAAFYTQGAAIFALDDAAVRAALERTAPTIVMLKRTRSQQVPAEWLLGWKAVDERSGFLRLERASPLVAR
jgi:4-amino-4-deoxy-L-arabinose transferase-like glycosyltransferase